MKVVRRIVGVLISLTLVGALAFIVMNPRQIQDWWILRDYEPSARVESIATKATMTDYSRRLFYVYDPKIEGAESFNAHCTVAEVSIILGCYDGIGIFVFDVQDERLSGVEEVTAVHEMLHAAYDRLSEKERARVDGLTQKQFQKLSNERIQTTIKAYRARDASVVPNELHSILASEVRDLDPELEEYYSQYFVDRSTVVAFSEGYERVFNEIKAKVERLDADLTLLKARIDSIESDLSRSADDIRSQKQQLDSLLARDEVDDYNARVPDFNALVNAYNATLATYKDLIAEYNTKVATRNEVTVEQNNLVGSLSSKAQEL